MEGSNQVIAWEDRLPNELKYVEWDVKPYHTILYNTILGLLLDGPPTGSLIYRRRQRKYLCKK